MHVYEYERHRLTLIFEHNMKAQFTFQLGIYKGQCDARTIENTSVIVREM